MPLRETILEFEKISKWLMSNGYNFVNSSKTNKHSGMYKFVIKGEEVHIVVLQASDNDLKITCSVMSNIGNNHRGGEVDFEGMKKFIFTHNKFVNRDNILDQLI